MRRRKLFKVGTGQVLFLRYQQRVLQVLPLLGCGLNAAMQKCRSESRTSARVVGNLEVNWFIRHTTATHLHHHPCLAGARLANTTNVYAEVDLEMKAKALATCEIRGAVPTKRWKDAVALMQFLRSL